MVLSDSTSRNIVGGQTMVELKFKLVQHAHAIVQLDLVVQVSKSLFVLQIRISTVAHVVSMDLDIHTRVQVASRIRIVT